MQTWLAIAVVVLSLLFGILFSVRVGGADMPVLISLLNAFSGLSAGICGIVVKSHVLTACGATVAASGLILTYAMCRAMNRNLWGIMWAVAPAPLPLMFSAGQPDSLSEGCAGRDRRLRTKSHRPIPFHRPPRCCGRRKIIVIPGYGMALAHAQIATVQLANRLREMGKNVKFAIHPLAGRMPGHMHVLLAEAEIDPDMLFDLNEVNSEFLGRRRGLDRGGLRRRQSGRGVRRRNTYFRNADPRGPRGPPRRGPQSRRTPRLLGCRKPAVPAGHHDSPPRRRTTDRCRVFWETSGENIQ